MAVPAMDFFSRESCWGHWQSRSLGTVVSLTAWLFCKPRFSFFLPRNLYMSQLCRSLGWMKLDPQLVSPKAREASYSLTTLPYPERGMLSRWFVPLGTKQCQTIVWAYAGKMKLFVLPFWCFYSQGFCLFVLSLCC